MAENFHIDNGLETVELALLIQRQEPEGLFLFILAQCEGVRGCELAFAAIEFLKSEFIKILHSSQLDVTYHKLIFELLARLLKFTLVFCVVFLEFLEFGMQLDGKRNY